MVVYACVWLCVYEDDWSRLEWSDGGRVCVYCLCVCMKMIGVN